jgi:Flp pilus assembly pilin Flp
MRIPGDRTGTTAAIIASMKTIKLFLNDEAGQTATEYMLLVSVVVIAVVAAAYVFVPQFQQGVQKLASDVSTILDGGCINGCAAGWSPRA